MSILTALDRNPRLRVVPRREGVIPNQISQQFECRGDVAVGQPVNATTSADKPESAPKRVWETHQARGLRDQPERPLQDAHPGQARPRLVMATVQQHDGGQRQLPGMATQPQLVRTNQCLACRPDDGQGFRVGHHRPVEPDAQCLIGDVTPSRRGQQACGRGLARAGRADQRDHLARGQGDTCRMPDVKAAAGQLDAATGDPDLGRSGVPVQVDLAIVRPVGPNAARPRFGVEGTASVAFRKANLRPQNLENQPRTRSRPSLRATASWGRCRICSPETCPKP